MEISEEENDNKSNSLPYTVIKKKGIVYDSDEKQYKQRLHSGSSNSEEILVSLEKIMDDPAAVK